MLTWEDDVEVHALRKRGWTISAIARHTGFDRKTVRKYLAGDGKPGERSVSMACMHCTDAPCAAVCCPAGCWAAPATPLV